MVWKVRLPLANRVEPNLQVRVANCRLRRDQKNLGKQRQVLLYINLQHHGVPVPTRHGSNEFQKQVLAPDSNHFTGPPVFVLVQFL